MTRTEQERLVERYLNGEMSSVDEQEFFIQVAVDNNLRQTLKAYRIVESALRKHRDAVPPHHAEARSRMITMLHTSSVAHAGPSGVTPAGLAPMASGRSSIWRRSSAVFKWIIAAVAAGGFTVAGFMIASDVEEAPEEITPSSGAPTHMNAPAGAPKAPASEAVSPTVTLPESKDARDAGTSITADNPGSERERQVAEGRSERQRTRSQNAETPSRSLGGSPADPQSQEQASTPLSTSRNDGTGAEGLSTAPTSQQEGSSNQTSEREEPALHRQGKDSLGMRMQLNPPKPRQ